MKTMKKLTLAVMATAVIGFAATAASAASVTTNPSDLILAFELPNNNYDVEVDLGSESGFTQSTTTETLTQLNVSDLNTAYGSAWSSTTLGSGATWSVSGVTGTPTSNSLDITTVSPSSPSKYSNSGLQNLEDAVNALNNGTGGIDGATSGTNTFTAILGTSTDNANTDSTTYPSSYGNLLSSLQAYESNLQTVGASSDELYALSGSGTHGGSTDLGTFSLSSGGVLTFTGADAVPEPSAYALGICAAVLFFVLRRRQKLA